MRRFAPVFLLAGLAGAAPGTAGEGGLHVVRGTPPGTVDLSAEGAVDWAHWGLIKGNSVLHRKAGSEPRIGALEKIGDREAHTFENNVTAIGWSDGSPTREVSRTRSGLFTYGQGNGFRVTAPAGKATRTLKVYAGAWRASGRLEASLGDGSAPTYSDTTEPDPTGEVTNVVYTLTYRAASEGQDLTVTWTNPGNGGNVEFLAVALTDGERAARPGARRPAFPLKASPDGRYLVDRDAVPFFYHADTAWRAIQALTPAEAARYLDDRKARGFTAVHLHAINKEETGPANREGQHPFDPKDDLTRPVEAYWRHADAVVQAASDRGLLVVLSSSWFGYNGSGWRKELNPESARAYGQFLGRRYKWFDNILWVHVGDNDPGDKADAVEALVSEIRAEAPHHLHTAHNHPEHASAHGFPEADWLDVNMAYTYEPAHVHVAAERARKGRARPIVLGETGYEGESNTGFRWTPSLVRRQAYRALLAGACGHANGSATIWDFGPGWERSLDMEAMRQMAHVKALFTAIPWWELEPDAEGALLASGRGGRAAADDALAARVGDGRIAVIYCPTPRPLTVDLGKLIGRRLRACWFNPRDGTMHGPRAARAGDAMEEFPASGTREFRPPSRGEDEDWVLVLHDADRESDLSKLPRASD